MRANLSKIYVKMSKTIITYDNWKAIIIGSWLTMIILVGLLLGVGLLFGADHMYPYTPKYYFLILGLHQISYIEYWIYKWIHHVQNGNIQNDIDTKWYYTESRMYKMWWLVQKFKISKSPKPGVAYFCHSQRQTLGQSLL